jgi:hypothetical protein
MSDFYADNRYYIDFSKIVFIENGGSLVQRAISISFLNGETHTFYENEDRDYKAFIALRAWHNEKIKEVK